MKINGGMFGETPCIHV